jgi:uncharacterized protein YbjT (DUF2867 family)
MILITGATGTVGSEVLKRLSAQDIEVRAVTRDSRKAEANLLPLILLLWGLYIKGIQQREPLRIH